VEFGRYILVNLLFENNEKDKMNRTNFRNIFTIIACSSIILRTGFFEGSNYGYFREFE